VGRETALRGTGSFELGQRKGRIKLLALLKNASIILYPSRTLLLAIDMPLIITRKERQVTNFMTYHLSDRKSPGRHLPFLPPPPTTTTHSDPKPNLNLTPTMFTARRTCLSAALSRRTFASTPAVRFSPSISTLKGAQPDKDDSVRFSLPPTLCLVPEAYVDADLLVPAASL
jgi:hypothetical protein